MGRKAGKLNERILIHSRHAAEHDARDYTSEYYDILIHSRHAAEHILCRYRILWDRILIHSRHAAEHHCRVCAQLLIVVF